MDGQRITMKHSSSYFTTNVIVYLMKQFSSESKINPTPKLYFAALFFTFEKIQLLQSTATRAVKEPSRSRAARGSARYELVQARLASLTNELELKYQACFVVESSFKKLGLSWLSSCYTYTYIHYTCMIFHVNIHMYVNIYFLWVPRGCSWQWQHKKWQQPMH